MENLPEAILNQIQLYMSHPTADLIKTSIMFRIMKHRSEMVHGCPFDRGSADAYYGRDLDPHYWTNGNNKCKAFVIETSEACRNGLNGGRVDMEDMTDNELTAYVLGYISEQDRKYPEFLEFGWVSENPLCFFCDKTMEGSSLLVCSTRCLMRSHMDDDDLCDSVLFSRYSGASF